MDDKIPDLTDMKLPATMPWFKKRTTIRAVQIIDGPFTVRSKEGTVAGKAGDYLAVGIEGERYIIDREIFKKTYEPTGELSFSPLKEGKVHKFLLCPIHKTPLVELAYDYSALGLYLHCIKGECLQYSVIPRSYIEIIEGLVKHPPKERITYRTGDNTTDDIGEFLRWFEREFGLILSQNYFESLMMAIMNKPKEAKQQP